MVRSASGTDITPEALAELSKLSTCIDGVLKTAESTYTSDGPDGPHEDQGFGSGLQKNGW